MANQIFLHREALWKKSLCASQMEFFTGFNVIYILSTLGNVDPLPWTGRMFV